jgi:hypothetical protein
MVAASRREEFIGAWSPILKLNAAHFRFDESLIPAWRTGSAIAEQQ